jgi:hypothetical protein
MTRRSKPRRAPRRPNTAVRESAYGAALDGVGIDADDHLWRSLTGSRGENLPEYKHEKMLGVAKYLFRTNPVAHRFITLLGDFVLGEGVAFAFKNDAVRDVIEAHWNDPENKWNGSSMGELFESYFITGELLMPLFANKVTGHLRIGAVINEQIDRVNTNPENWRDITSVKMKTELGATEGKTYTIVNSRESPETLQVTDPALFWRRNNPFGSRGISILYPLADFLDLLDQMAFSEVERWILQKAFVWDVTLEGANEGQVSAWIRKPENASPPRPGSVRAHNEQETWQAISPGLDTHDATNGMTWLRNHTLGAGGMPEHWYASGGDVNRAVGVTMAEPVRKRLSRVQEEWRDILVDVFRAQVDYAILAGTLPAEVETLNDRGEPSGEFVPACDAFDVSMPDLSPADTSQVATTLQTLASTLMIAIDENFVSEDTARRAFLLQLQTTGVDFNTDEELERIEEQVKQREEEMAQMPQAVQPPVQLQALAGGKQQVAAGGD